MTYTFGVQINIGDPVEVLLEARLGFTIATIIDFQVAYKPHNLVLVRMFSGDEGWTSRLNVRKVTSEYAMLKALEA